MRKCQRDKKKITFTARLIFEDLHYYFFNLKSKKKNFNEKAVIISFEGFLGF